MPLTTTQLVTLAANIRAAVDAPVVTALANGNDNEIARLYNLDASPAFTVWKTSVTINAIGDKINGTELAGLSSLNTTRLQAVVMLSPAGVNPSLIDRRQFFDDIFSGAGGTTTRAQLLALWKRFATRAEKLYATGTGSDASPATLVFEGSITGDEVARALRP